MHEIMRDRKFDPVRILKRLPLIPGSCRAILSLRLYLGVLGDFLVFRKLSARTSRPVFWKDRHVCLWDRTEKTGFDRHYVFHTAWAARVLVQTSPDRHVDISSSLYFCSIVSAFIPMDFYDYRPAELNLSQLSVRTANLLALPFERESISSLSCMHVIEHIGLGRYGDQLDPDGDLKAIGELKRVLAHGGNLLFVVPVGSSRTVFNAHRIYSYSQIMDYFSDLHLVEFSLIPEAPDQGGLIRNAPQHLADEQGYGCGCFWFRK